MTAVSKDETADPDRYRREELARWLDVELDHILRSSSPSAGYRDAISEVAMVVLVDFLEHPEHRGLSRRKDEPGSPSLHGTLTVTSPGIFRSKVTETMWDTSLEAADAVLAHLAAGD